MSFLSNIFGKSSRGDTPADLSILNADMHSHLIPAIDDGSKSLEDSIAMITAFAELGYKKIITTPHIMSDAYRNTPEIILNGLENVRAALREKGVAIEMEAAAEYYIDFEFEQMIDKKQLLTFGKNYVLVETSFINPPDNLNAIFFKLITNNYKPVFAHPERYSFWHGNFEKYEEIIEKGAILQLNINSLTGQYGPAVKKIAERMIDNNMISLVGSDCHHLGHVNLMKQVRFEKSLHKLLASGKLLNSTL